MGKKKYDDAPPPVDKRNDHREWVVKCPHCKSFIQHQKGEPTICPRCGEKDIDTRPID